MDSSIKLGGAFAAFACPLALSAADNSPCSQLPLHGMMLAVIFSIMGAVLLLLCFKAFDKAITKIDFEEEIKKGNMAAAIVAAAVIVGISIIIAASIFG